MINVIDGNTVTDILTSGFPKGHGLTAHFTVNTTYGSAPLAVAFTDMSAGSPAAWNWSFGDGYFSFLKNPTHIYTEPGEYTVRLEVS